MTSTRGASAYVNIPEPEDSATDPSDRATTVSIKKLRIRSYDESEGHTRYNIRCLANGKRFASQHRFSEFLALHEVLSPVLGLPKSFPVAKTTLPFQGAALKNERMKQLQDYLNIVTASCEQQPPSALLDFLCISRPGHYVEDEAQFSLSSLTSTSFYRSSVETMVDAAASWLDALRGHDACQACGSKVREGCDAVRVGTGEAALRLRGSTDSFVEAVKASETAAKLNEAGGSAAAKLNEMGAATSAKLNEVGDFTSAKINEVGAATSAKINEVGAATSAKINELGAATSAKLNEVGDFTSAKINELSPRVVAATDSLKSTVASSLEPVGAALAPVAEKVTEATGEAARKASVAMEPAVGVLRSATGEAEERWLRLEEELEWDKVGREGSRRRLAAFACGTCALLALLTLCLSVVGHQLPAPPPPAPPSPPYPSLPPRPPPSPPPPYAPDDFQRFRNANHDPGHELVSQLWSDRVGDCKRRCYDTPNCHAFVRDTWAAKCRFYGGTEFDDTAYGIYMGIEAQAGDGFDTYILWRTS